MKVKDGWHVLNGWEVWVENGRVVRGIVYNANGRCAGYPYKYRTKSRTWERGTPTVGVFYHGWKIM